ncbi:MAG TPA: polysaccharide biosynthesis C-terminal domain-containing protein, partial [Rubrobacteraceae bacterium]|nr:polysaccharide biosynthesis C-terminal domain-containing protein [Rubrobacteraceae bacterium]
YGAGGDTARVRGTILQALGVTFVLSIVLSGGIFLGAGFLAEEVFGKPFLKTMFRAFSVSIPFLTLMSMTLWATQGFQTVKYATLVQHVLRPLANLILVVVFYLLGIEIMGAVAAYMLSMVLGAAAALYYLRRVFPELLESGVRPRYESRELSAVSGPMIVANLTQYVNLWTAVIVLGVFEPAPVVGVYDVAARTAGLSTLVLISFGGIFSPMASSLHRQGLMRDLGYLYEDVSRWAFTGSLFVFVVTAVLSRDIMQVFGEGFSSGWPVIVVIAAAQLFNSSVGPTARLLAMTGHQKAVMVSTLGSAGIAVATSLLLVPPFGILGAAAATATALVAANVATLFFVRRRLGFWPYGRRYLKPLLAGLAVAAAIYFSRGTLPADTGLLALAICVPLALVVFAILLFSLGLSPSDRQFLASFGAALGRLARRVWPKRRSG